MSRALLTKEELAEASRQLVPLENIQSVDLASFPHWSGRKLSEWLVETLIRKWEMDKDFFAAGPILLGSAARKEMTLRSDVDLLLVGDQEAGAGWVRSLQEQGVKVRARFPEDFQDWTVGAGVEDHLALLEARPLTTEAESVYRAQLPNLWKLAKANRRKILKHILIDQQQRRLRHDSISGFLEANLKYGPGGLRDLDQARQIARLFPEKFVNEKHSLDVLESYCGFWLTLRHRLHLDGQGDVLTGQAQFDLARWLGVEHKILMRLIQKGLARVSFHSLWVGERAKTSEKEWHRISQKKWQQPKQLLDALELEPSLLMQQKVRLESKNFFNLKWMQSQHVERGRLLRKVLRPGASEDFIRAVFSSRLIDWLCPQVRQLRGLVQHDQYHRYAADIHLQQACVQFQRTLLKPRRLGVLAQEVRDLTSLDRNILGWAVLFHDLLKGQEGDHATDHATLGSQWVRAELKKFQLEESLIEEVSWLVQHHLELSQAAFRKNPHAAETWHELSQIGVVGNRLRRLVVFTAIDILATNPEAWTPWKARLLFDLVSALRSPSVRAFQKWTDIVHKEKMPAVYLGLDSLVIENVSLMKLLKDLKAAGECFRQKANLPPLVLTARGQTWIRFHDALDTPGLFAKYVRQLYELGVNIRHASVQTVSDVGVYDWFQVSTRRPAVVLQKRLLAAGGAPGEVKIPNVSFTQIQWVQKNEKEWIVSFQGIDQAGLLAAAATALANCGCSIRAARVHTWGKKVDDLFHLEPHVGVEDPVHDLQWMVKK